MDDQSVIREFLIESNENLVRLDQEMVELEKRPRDPQLLAGIFRTIHTIKGTCGFLGFSSLEAVAHLAEDILSQLRDGKRDLTPELVTLILEAVDVIKTILVSIETAGHEGTDTYEDLRRRLEAASAQTKTADAPNTPAVSSEAEKPAAQRGPSVADSTIRVDVVLLDKLMNLVGELVLARNQILQFNAHQEDATLNATSQRLNLITTELQEGVMKTRMQPIGVVWNKLPRLVRDLATSFGKQIQLEMDGADTELDKTIIEAIKDPLTHIIRNCCDHGIEKPDARVRKGKPAQGRLTLRAFHEGGQVNIEISDDGAGMDVQVLKNKAVQRGLVRGEQAERMTEREALSLVFLPGFSTADEVTSVSGRGVGMDVVKTNIEKIGGVVDLVSRLGEGTTLKLKIPLTLAIIPGLVVTLRERRSVPRCMTGVGMRYVIPQVSLLELIRLEGDSGKRQIERIHDTPFYRRRGSLLPLVYLTDVLQSGPPLDSGVVNIVVLQAEDRQFGLVVDGISDTQEIVVKPLGKQLKGLNCYAGATIMGDGRVALILDVSGIAQLAGVVQDSHEKARVETAAGDHAATARQTYLLFRAGAFERLAVPLSLVARLEEIAQSKIEHAGGKRVVQYRGRILQLASLAPILDPGAADTAGLQDPAQVVVFSHGDRDIGILVDQILDIVEDQVVTRQAALRSGLLGSAVIARRVTDLLDLHTVIESVDQGWFSSRGLSRARAATVMIAESSSFVRGMLRNSLEMAGYRVVESADAQVALRELERSKIDVVLASVDLPSTRGRSFVDEMRSLPGMNRVPTLAMIETPEQAQAYREHPQGFSDCQMKFDRDAMLRSLARLAGAVAAPEPVPAGEKS
ncbi:MAG TPA: chemotaxis protein CheW [Bryobacteraceae bacterium]|nr:chemotaxis protein CheW [Bryobacteraceae bacterium]